MHRGKSGTILFSLVLLVGLMSPLLLFMPAKAAASERAHPSSIDLQLSFPGLGVTDKGDGTQALDMVGYPAAREIGMPAIPSRTLNIALPPGTRAADAYVVVSEWYEIPGSFTVEWGQQPLTSQSPPGGQAPQPTQADADVYASDTAFPAAPVGLLGSGRMRCISIAEVRVSPVRYYPASGRIEACRSMSIRVGTAADSMPAPEELASQPFDESVSEIVYNFEQARQWYEGSPGVETTGITTSGTGDAADYVVITPEALASAVEPLTDYKESQGLSTRIVTTEWLAANIAGVDLAEQIRNFLRDDYATLGTDYVLLAGSHASIPMRVCCAPTPGFPTGRIYSDYYYCDLSGDWDLNDDGRYGEMGIDDQPGGADFFPEVYVGRIPSDDPVEMAAICRKIADFQVDPGAWKLKALLLGAASGYLLESPNFLPAYGSAVSQKIKADILDPLGYETTTMYEKEGLAPDTTPCELPLTLENVLGSWPDAYGIVNIKAHGSTNAVYRKIWKYDNGNGIPEASEMYWKYFLDSSDTAVLDDSRPSIVFSCACLNAEPVYSNNLMASLLRKGACAAVGSTGLSYYIAAWQSEYLGGNDSMSYVFWRYLLQDGYRAGKALRMGDVWMKSYCDWLGNYNRANLFDFNLYGDPSMKLSAEGSPSISSIDPASAWNMGPLNIGINGANFLDGARVMLRASGHDDIEAGVATADSSTHISATVDIAGAPPGRWSVVVRNPDGQEAVLKDGFEVTSLCGTGGGAALLVLCMSLGLLYAAGSLGRRSRRRRRPGGR